MKRVCMVCGKTLGYKYPFHDLRTTHGICEKCARELEERDEEGDAIEDTDEVLGMSFGSSYEGRREG